MPRKKGYKHNQRTRDAIKASALKNRLEAHCLGESILTSSQVSGIKILLAKILPDLQQIDQVIDTRGDLSDAELDRRIEALQGTEAGASKVTH